MNARTITVFGEPMSQGSKKAHIIRGKNGAKPRAIVSEGGGEHAIRRKAWRADVAAAASAWIAANGSPPPLDGNLVLDATFYLARPASAPKRVTFPNKKPDLDKLTRSIGDSLSGIIYADDARIVDLNVRKRFAIGRPPGVVITVAIVEESHPSRGVGEPSRLETAPDSRLPDGSPITAVPTRAGA